MWNLPICLPTVGLTSRLSRWWFPLKVSFVWKAYMDRMRRGIVESMKSLNHGMLLTRSYPRNKDNFVVFLASSNPCISPPLLVFLVVLLRPFGGFCNWTEQRRPLGVLFMLNAFIIILFYDYLRNLNPLVFSWGLRLSVLLFAINWLLKRRFDQDLVSQV